MAQNGYYAYDPTNYHGPFHFYVLFLSLKLLGRNLWALRLPVVLASLLTIFWIFLFRPFFSRTICYLAALGMALSPGFIFYDRYSIHESWMVLFLTVTCWGILGVWTSREAKYFWGLILGLTGMMANPRSVSWRSTASQFCSRTASSRTKLPGASFPLPGRSCFWQER